MAEHTVCVTGANGFIASHVVQQCLAKGWKVRGTVRDLSDASKTTHLRGLPNAAANLELFQADLINPTLFAEPLAGCDGVIHMATPVIVGASATKETTYDPAMAATQAILDAAANVPTIKAFILTSSMSAVAPVPEPPLKNESHWSDPDLQKSKNNWYGYTKTSQEKLVQAYVEGMPAASRWKYCAINPTGVLGPMLQPKTNMSMMWHATILNGKAMKQCSNDSMSYVDVRDVAAMHVAAFEKPEATGRYMCVAAAWHWNDIVAELRKLWPSMPEIAPCDGEPITPTQFDHTKQNSLGVNCRSVEQILADMVVELQAKGVIQ